MSLFYQFQILTGLILQKWELNLTDKGENRNWTDRKKRPVSISLVTHCNVLRDDILRVKHALAALLYEGQDLDTGES